MDKLQPIDVSTSGDNKISILVCRWSTKTTERNANRRNYRIDLTTLVVKTNCARWLIATVQDLQQCPATAINGFKESGILDAVDTVIN